MPYGDRQNKSLSSPPKGLFFTVNLTTDLMRIELDSLQNLPG